MSNKNQDKKAVFRLKQRFRLKKMNSGANYKGNFNRPQSALGLL